MTHCKKSRAMKAIQHVEAAFQPLAFKSPRQRGWVNIDSRASAGEAADNIGTFSQLPPGTPAGRIVGNAATSFEAINSPLLL
jgi:hypothetical protein